ncbi:pentapeptide repeat-containing protein [Nakamurella sp. PAMC28650]|nr:pentapeptide repeat-containing protein [Nakamurella sp. PAMC28650]
MAFAPTGIDTHPSVPARVYAFTGTAAAASFTVGPAGAADAADDRAPDGPGRPSSRTPPAAEAATIDLIRARRETALIQPVCPGCGAGDGAPGGVSLIGSCLSALLVGADLCRADLCGADLCGADLCRADLCGPSASPPGSAGITGGPGSRRRRCGAGWSAGRTGRHRRCPPWGRRSVR